MISGDKWNEDDFHWTSAVYRNRALGYSIDHMFDFSVTTDVKNSTWRILDFDQASLGLPRKYLIKGKLSELVFLVTVHSSHPTERGATDLEMLWKGSGRRSRGVFAVFFLVETHRKKSPTISKRRFLAFTLLINIFNLKSPHLTNFIIFPAARRPLVGPGPTPSPPHPSPPPFSASARTCSVLSFPGEISGLPINRLIVSLELILS